MPFTLNPACTLLPAEATLKKLFAKIKNSRYQLDNHKETIHLHQSTAQARGDFYVSFIYIVAMRSQTSLHVMDGRIGNFHRNFRSNGVVIGSFCTKGVGRPKPSPTENTLLSIAKVKLPFRLSGSRETALTLTKLVEGNIENQVNTYTVKRDDSYHV